MLPEHRAGVRMGKAHNSVSEVKNRIGGAAVSAVGPISGLISVSDVRRGTRAPQGQPLTCQPCSAPLFPDTSSSDSLRGKMERRLHTESYVSGLSVLCVTVASRRDIQ